MLWSIILSLHSLLFTESTNLTSMSTHHSPIKWYETFIQSQMGEDKMKLFCSAAADWIHGGAVSILIIGASPLRCPCQRQSSRCWRDMYWWAAGLRWGGGHRGEWKTDACFSVRSCWLYHWIDGWLLFGFLSLDLFRCWSLQQQPLLFYTWAQHT